MFNPKYKYVGLDFETTGLDYLKDEPIQIGIVMLDEKGKIMKEFKSLIKPRKNIDELKDIVGFITGLKLEDLATAPYAEDLYEQVSQFFDENTIVVGHNVDFDLYFLDRFFPGLKYNSGIDTYNWSQVFVHFAPSYALEVLAEYLFDKEPEFKNIMIENGLRLDDKNSEVTFHDALQDTKVSLLMFVYFVSYINRLCDKYPDIKYFLKQENTVFSKIFGYEANNDSSGKTWISFPNLQRSMPSNIKLTSTGTPITVSGLENHKKFYVGNSDFKELCYKLAENKNVIFAFSHKQKLDIAKKYLQEIGIKNIGFAREDQVINHKVLEVFLNKGKFTQEEVFFVLKYVSHLFKGAGFLDLNIWRDRQIYYFLKESADVTRYPIVLTTHPGLYSILDNKTHSYADYDVCFFDVEWRYKNYNNYLSRECDLYSTLYFIETLLYAYKLRNSIKDGKYQDLVDRLVSLHSTFQIFMGTIFIESTKFFVNNQNDTFTVDLIIDNSQFRKTNILWQKILDKIVDIKPLMLDADTLGLTEHVDNISHVFNTIVTITKQMYMGSLFFFTYKESVKFTNRDEFVEKFEDKHAVFLSNHNKQYPKLSEELPANNSVIKKFIYPGRVDKIIEYVFKGFASSEECVMFKSCFVLSSQKFQSKELFDKLYRLGLHENVELLAENITGGIGKCVFKAKKAERRLMIGSYNFLMWLYSNDIDIDKVLVLNIKGTQEQQMLDDLQWYGK